MSERNEICMVEVYPVAEFFGVVEYQKLIDNILTYLTECLNNDYIDLRVQDKWELVS